MRYCPNCGRTVKPGDKYCMHCIKPLDNRDEVEDLGGQKPQDGSQVGTRKSRRNNINPQSAEKVERSCAYCDGTGLERGSSGTVSPVRCRVCRGKHTNLVSKSWPRCIRCGGEGKQWYGGGLTKIKRPCPKCSGTGWAPE
jgi:hypothetical protein